MKRTLWLLVLMVLTLPGAAQTFKGKVTDVAGNPIPYAALYLREIKSGFATDDNGRFQTILKEGEYTCEVSSLGFTSQTFTFRMPPTGFEKRIVLSEQIYALRQVNIVKGSEDPAYAIMRKAIARAPYYRTQVKGFTASTYLKGTGKMKRIPAILKLSKEIRRDSKEFMGKLFVLEEEQQVTFKAPETWDLRIKASRNSFPEKMQMKIGLTTINLYQPSIWGKVSPLSRGAFSYYRFKLEGCYPDGDRLINKIKVIPKKDSPRLVGGDLFIVEDLWCVSAADFSIRSGGMDAIVKVTCKEVQPSVFLATSTSMTSTFDVMGFKADASYLAAVHYTKVELGSGQPETMQKKEVPKGMQKVYKQMEELSSKEDLTMNDAYRLAKLLEKAGRASDTLRRKNKYELAPRMPKRNEQKDSLADQKDSLYWEKIRSTPLRPEEMQSYAEKEKKLALKDSLYVGGKTKQSAGGKVLQTFLTGRTFRTRDKQAWLSLSGLPSYLPRYNFVDGFWLGAQVKTGIHLSESTSLQFLPSVYYTTARKAWVGQGKLLLDYAPARRGQLTLAGGVLSDDYNEESGESRLPVYIATSLFGRNDVKFFEKRFLMLEHQIEPGNGLLFSSSLSWQRRSMLENQVSRSWFGKSAKPNVPETVAFRPMPQNERLKASFALEYTPEHYYRMSHGKKRYERSAYPTFKLRYDRAFPLAGHRVSSSYHMLELSAKQKIEFGMFNELHWSVDAGAFWNASGMQFPDFHHFASAKFPLTERSFSDGFSLADNYAYSTDSRWARANLSWHTPYLLLKQLPFLKKTLLDEALHLHSLVTYHNDPYTEAGYSVGYSNIARIGVFVGFSRLRYRWAGVSVSLPLSVLISH